MTLQPSSHTPPSNDPFYEKDGSTISQSWLAYFQSGGLSQTKAAQAAQAAAAAQTTATGANVAATAALAQITALLAAPPLWVIGDYRQTGLASLGANWLPCDGSEQPTASYPDLSGVLLPITGAGSGVGTFKLPSIASVFDAASPSGPPVMQWFIRAL